MITHAGPADWLTSGGQHRRMHRIVKWSERKLLLESWRVKMRNVSRARKVHVTFEKTAARGWTMKAVSYDTLER